MVDSGAGPAAAGLTIPLVRPPFWSRGLVFLLLALGLVAFNMMAVLLDALQTDGSAPVLRSAAVALAGCAVLALGVIGRRLWVRARPLPPVVFHASHVSLPVSLESNRSREVAYRDIMSVGARGQAPGLALVIETRRDLYIFPLLAFASPDRFETLARELSSRVLAQPEAGEMVAQAERRRLVAVQALAIRPLATQAILGVIGVVFINMVLTDALLSPVGLLRWGANAPALVQEGEHFRLLAATFLHAGSLHVLLNGIALFYLGSVLERFLGWPRFVIVYLASGVAASVLSAYVASGAMSVGALGAIFGLLGGLAAINWRYGTDLPLGIRQPRRWWAAVLGIIVILVLVLSALPPGMAPQIDGAAHLGGLIAGALVTLALLPPRHALRAAPPAPASTYALAFGLVALHLWGLGQAVLHAAHFDAAAERRALTLLVDDPRADANSLNVLAWSLAIDPLRDQADFAVAERAARRAVEMVPEEPAYRDTLATVFHRQGKHDEAVALERQALGEADQPFYASQLARFLAARVEAGGVVALGVDAGVFAVGMAPKGDGIEAEATAPLGTGITALAVVREGERLVGLVELSFADGFRGPQTIALADLPEWATRERLRVQLLLVEAKRDATPASRFWPAEPAVHELP